jgi:hypothetical protein
LKWIDRLFGKKEGFSPEITLDELPGWLESRSQKISGEISKYASSLYSHIESTLGEIKESTASLEEAELEGRFHLKMVKIATSNRDNMVKQVRMLLENITIPKSTDVATVVGFHDSAVQTLTVCLENMMKSYQYTKLVFLEESKQVIADVNALGRLLNQLIEPIKNQKNVLEAFEKVKLAIQNIKKTTLDIELGEKTIKENQEKIVHLKKEIEEKQKVLTLLRDSENWKQYTKYREDLILLENNARKKETEINSIILPLNKGLGRLKQLSDSGRYTLKPQSRDDLNLCLKDPKYANPEFFAEFQNIVESGILNLTPEKTNKILEQIKFAISSFGETKKEYHAIVIDIERKKDDISGLNIGREEKELTEKNALLQEKLIALENKVEISKNHLVSLRQALESTKQELQQNISVIDSKIRIS